MVELEKKQVANQFQPVELNQTEKMIAFIQSMRASKIKTDQIVGQKDAKDDISEVQSEENSRKSEDSASDNQHSRASKN